MTILKCLKLWPLRPAKVQTISLLILVATWAAFPGPLQAQVFLNEVCAENSGAVLSPGGTSPDYIELFNAGPSTADISFWGLTDNSSSPGKFRFPAGTTIPVRGFLVVWLDDAATYDGLVCTNFALKVSGEQIGLYSGAVLKDQVRFGAQVEGLVLCRTIDGSGAWSIGTPSPSRANQPLSPAAFGVASALRINEWLATNSAGADLDWLEIHNPKTNGLVAIGGLVISDLTSGVNTPAIVQNSFIDSGGFLRFWCDDSTSGGNHLDFKLSSTSGETLTLYQPDRITIIDRVVFGRQNADVSMGRLPDGSANLFLFPGTELMTPGEANAYRPLTNVVISEVLTHTDPPLEDAVELYNPTAGPVDIGNWWLSNDKDSPLKFRIPSGTIIPPGGFVVFYEQNPLNGSSTTPGFNRSGTGKTPDFVFSSDHGDSAVLTEALPNGTLTGYRAAKEFGAAANGVSFGRYVKSDGGTDMVAMAARSFGSDAPSTVAQFRTGSGLPNSAPLIGPLVISEIQYHPPSTVSGGSTNDNSKDEFIELANVSNAVLPLYDPLYPTNHWRLRGGISYDFPPNANVHPLGRLLLVNFDPVTELQQLAAFRAKYNVAADVPLFGPYSGKLNNSSDTLQLEKPDPVQLPPHPDAGFVPFVLVERVKHEAGNGWPTNASGTGLSIQRYALNGYANDHTNWFGASPSAGLANPIPTNPPPAMVEILNPTLDAAGFVFSFVSEPAHNYQVQFSPSLDAAGWQTLTNLTASGSMLTVRDADITQLQRYYRVLRH